MAAAGGDVLPLRAFVRRTHLARIDDAIEIRIPSPMRVAAGLALFAVIVASAVLALVPWVQTAAGAGTIVALNPEDRVQDINVFVDGRIKRWYVQDGSQVAAGEPILEVTDLDPNLVQRLEADRDAQSQRLAASRSATQTAKLNYDRQKRLYDDGLTSRREFEAAKIRYQELLATQASASASVNQADISLSRQSSQIVRAPQDGRILQITAGDQATLVRSGQRIAIFAPADVRRAVEIFINGVDAPLVHPGRPVQLAFEGWPTIQFSGWPETARGTFPGIVSSVDPAVSANGRFRVLVVEDKSDPWPDGRYLRLGAQVRAWIQLETVPLGYELWRLLNQFPPLPATRNAQSGAGGSASSGSGSGSNSSSGSASSSQAL